MSSISDWRYRLQGDPAAWLLDADDNPSIYFWFQRDVVGRPEDAPALVQARERIVYSTPVQELFATQDPAGFWATSESLDAPRHTATLWSLALLAELGAPRGSRRAHAACEYIFQNIAHSNGTVQNAVDPIYEGLMVRALGYFNRGDPRLAPMLRQIIASASQGDVFSLWALAENFHSEFLPAMERGVDRLFEAMLGGCATYGTFPPFDPKDNLLGLRTIALIGKIKQPRWNPVLERVWERQREGGRWSLDKRCKPTLAPSLWHGDSDEKWATLNALRVLCKI